MQLLAEIFRTEGISTEGRTIFREAVRAITIWSYYLGLVLR